MGKSESAVYFKATKGSHGDDCLKLRVAESSWMIKNKSGTYCAAVRTHSCCCSCRGRRTGITNIMWERSRRQEWPGDAIYIKLKHSDEETQPAASQDAVLFAGVWSCLGVASRDYSPASERLLTQGCSENTL